MQTPKKKIWYGSSMRPYPEGEPWYFDAKEISWASELEDNFGKWSEEVNDFIKEKDDKFVSSSVFYEKMDTERNWSAIVFLFWGLKVSNELKKKCPHLSEHLKEIPGLVAASFSRLNAHSTIAEHEGDTNAIMRCHIGVEVPSGLPECGFKVNGEEKSWAVGKCLLFNDAYKHSAWNKSNKRRIILIIDVVRPEFLHRKNLICAFILTRHVSYLYNRVKLIHKMPVFMKTILFAFILGTIYVLRPVYNFFKG